ncbi:MAG: zinc ribbon domain-containing protein, partial [candidate division NC10 bacterium]|nr:zinc ribbon domain-containing protein [candidate division NC10 bacterium]
MPTYEYSCEDCGKRVNIFFLSIKKAQEEAPRCPACGGGKLTRLISRFSTVRASSAGPDQGGDVPGLSELESGDPRSIARWM